MDFQKIKELALANGFSLKEQASGNMDLHSYVYEFANAIEQAAKAQAVPEGFVLVPEDQTKDTDRLNFLLGGEKYIRTVIHRDIQNDEYEKIGEHFQLTEVFWIDGFDYWENTSSDSERGAIDKAMIEAQEQKG